MDVVRLPVNALDISDGCLVIVDWSSADRSLWPPGATHTDWLLVKAKHGGRLQRHKQAAGLIPTSIATKSEETPLTPTTSL